MRQQQDGRKVQAREQEVGYHLGKDDPDGAHGRYQQHLHRPGLLLTDDRHGGHHGADQDKDQPHDPRNEIVGALHLRVVKQVRLGHRYAGLLPPKQDALHVTRPGRSRIGVRGIEDQLDGYFARGRMPRIGHQAVIIGGKNHDGFRLPRTQYVIDPGLRDISLECKIRVDSNTFHLLTDCLRLMGSHDREIDIVYLHRYGKAEQQQLHHGDTQHDEHRTAVAYDVERLLSDK